MVNETAPVRSVAEETNVTELTAHIALPLLAVVPFQANPYDGDIAALARVDWRLLANAATVGISH